MYLTLHCVEAVVCWLSKRISKGRGESWILASAKFCGGRNPTIVDFNYQCGAMNVELESDVDKQLS